MEQLYCAKCVDQMLVKRYPAQPLYTYWDYDNERKEIASIGAIREVAANCIDVISPSGIRMRNIGIPVTIKDGSLVCLYHLEYEKG